MKYCAYLFLLSFFLLSSHRNIDLTPSKDLLSFPETSIVSTGRTTGHIATLSVSNNTNRPMPIQGETFYIPAMGKYQPYAGRIPGNTSIPPNGSASIPISGFCVDVSKPPVPAGEAFAPIKEWISVGPGPSGTEVSLIPGDPVSHYSSSDREAIISSDAFQLGDPLQFDNITITYPGTEIPIAGTLDINKDPEVIAPLIVEIMDRVISATEDIMENDDFTTPISSDPIREAEAIAQQTIWIVMGALTGNAYTKEDFTARVHEQFESNTGNPVSTLPEEEQENMQAGVNDFWNTFTATGVEAKVLKSPGHVLTVSPQCECENISFQVTIKRGVREIYDEDHTANRASSSNSINIEVPDFEMGDAFDVDISDITVNCACNEVDCPFYPAQSTNSNSPGYTKPDDTKPGKVNILIENDGAAVANENHNCSHSDNEWNASGTTYSMKITTKDEGTNNAAVFQRFYIKAYCQMDGCRKDLCKRRIQLNFVSKK